MLLNVCFIKACSFLLYILSQMLLGNIDKDLFQIIHKFVLTNDVFTGELIV